MSNIALSSNNSGTGTFTIASLGTNTDRTLTLPDATGTINVSGLANEVPAGSNTAPAIYSTGDNNTGLFFPAADTVAVTTGGTERMRIDPSGNVGIGTITPNSGLHLKQTNAGGDVTARIQNSSTAADSKATLYFTTTPNDAFSSAFVGSDRNNALILGSSTMERMRINASGYVGINTATPAVSLHVIGNAILEGTSPNIVLAETDTTDQDVRIRAQDGCALFETVTDARAQVRENMRIDASGNLLVGLTSPTTGATDGSVSIRSNGINMFVGGGAIARESVAGLVFSGSDIVPFFNGATSDNGVDLGSSTLRWRDLNLSGALRSDVFTVTNIAGTERMRIDSTGYVGIGTTSPNVPLDVSSTGVGSTIVSRFYVTDNTVGLLRVGNSTTGDGATAPAFGSNATSAVIHTNNTERMRIDASGNLLVGTTTISGDGISLLPRGSASGTTSQISFNRASTTASGSVLAFLNAGTVVGTVQHTNTATSYNTTSDYRLKENIEPMQNALDIVAQLNPVTYTWKADGSVGQGFIAHELQAIVPDCVTGEKDAIDEDGNPEYQGIDTSFLVATLVKAIQEQQATIEALTSRIETLEAK